MYHLTDIDLAPVVEKLDCAIHRINHYPVDKYSRTPLFRSPKGNGKKFEIPGFEITGEAQNP